MNIELIRKKQCKESIDGTLYIGGLRICDCAENASTALPPGSYRIVRHFCRQQGRFVPLIVGSQASDDLPKFLEDRCALCPKLHSVTVNTNMPTLCPQFSQGNGIHHRTDGAVILGTRIIPGCMKHTRKPYESLMERIRKASGRKNEIVLHICAA